MEIKWRLTTFAELSTEELYAILKIRQQVFVVEQRCAYQDCDGRDNNALHLVGWHCRGEQPEPIAYLRVVYPAKQGGVLSIGRVLIHGDYRRKGLGKKIMRRCLRSIEELYPDAPVVISAQLYLLHFYESFGFRISSDGYDEDGIPHIQMTHTPRP